MSERLFQYKTHIFSPKRTYDTQKHNAISPCISFSLYVPCWDVVGNPVLNWMATLFDPWTDGRRKRKSIGSRAILPQIRPCILSPFTCLPCQSKLKRTHNTSYYSYDKYHLRKNRQNEILAWLLHETTYRKFIDRLVCHVFEELKLGRKGGTLSREMRIRCAVSKNAASIPLYRVP